MTSFLISASILSADLTCLGAETEAVLSGGADMIHIDAMDNHYVPALTFGPLICEALHRKNSQAILDVHLMVKPVDILITAFAQAGARRICFHPEASDHIDRSLRLIRSLGCQAGLALNPGTPLMYLDYLWAQLDFVLVMTVNPGFSGQSFISAMLMKIRRLKHLISAVSPQTRLAVDGGITIGNITEVAKAGADTFILGSALFGEGHYAKTLANLREALTKF